MACFHRQVLGEYALRERSLRSLGLTGGKAIIRWGPQEASDLVAVALLESRLHVETGITRYRVHV